MSAAVERTDYTYERVTPARAALLERESPRIFGHTACVLIFEGGSLGRSARGTGVDFDVVRRRVEAALHHAPRFRQKLARIPFENHPVWVDDRDFRVDYHLRHSSLPHPGSLDQLENTAARIMSQRLERSRPPWECWVLEGLEGGRFALILKQHLCMADDAADSDLLGALLSADPNEPTEAPAVFAPRPRPSARELVLDEVVRQVRLPRRFFERAWDVLSNPSRLAYEAQEAVYSGAALLGYSFRHPVDTPFNGRIGPHRNLAMFSTSLEEAKAISSALGGTIHDVVLATVAGGVRAYLGDRYVSPAAMDIRVSTPTALGTAADGDRSPREEDIVEWVIDLPVWERSPKVRFQQVAASTGALADADPAMPARVLISEQRPWIASRLLSMGARSLESHTPVNLTVTNVPGPQSGLYLAGARLLEAYGQVPLRDGQGLGVSVLSYDGRVFWGLNGDADLVPDISTVARRVFTAFLELRDTAGIRPAAAQSARG